MDASCSASGQGRASGRRASGQGATGRRPAAGGSEPDTTPPLHEPTPGVRPSLQQCRRLYQQVCHRRGTAVQEVVLRGGSRSPSPREDPLTHCIAGVHGVSTAWLDDLPLCGPATLAGVAPGTGDTRSARVDTNTCTADQQLQYTTCGRYGGRWAARYGARRGWKLPAISTAPVSDRMGHPTHPCRVKGQTIQLSS